MNKVNSQLNFLLHVSLTDMHGKFLYHLKNMQLIFLKNKILQKMMNENWKKF